MTTRTDRIICTLKGFIGNKEMSFVTFKCYRKDIDLIRNTLYLKEIINNNRELKSDDEALALKVSEDIVEILTNIDNIEIIRSDPFILQEA